MCQIVLSFSHFLFVGHHSTISFKAMQQLCKVSWVNSFLNFASSIWAIKADFLSCDCWTSKILLLVPVNHLFQSLLFISFYEQYKTFTEMSWWWCFGIMNWSHHIYIYHVCRRQKYLDIYSTSVCPSSSLGLTFLLVLRIFSKIFKAILTAYHKPIHVPCLLRIYFERCFLFLTNPRETSNISSTFQLLLW